MARKNSENLLGPVFGLAFLLWWLYPKQIVGLIKTLLFVAIGIALLVVLIKFIRSQQQRVRHRNSFPSVSQGDALRNRHIFEGQISEAAITDKLANINHLRNKNPQFAIEWSKEFLSALEWKRFEELCAAYFEAIGFNARLQRCGADGGVDVHLSWGESPATIAIVQCKAWSTYRVGVKPVRELYGVMMGEDVKEAFFITSGDYTHEAIEFAKDKNLTLVTGKELLSRINQLPKEQNEKLLALAASGDFTTPTCPSCGIKMVHRDGKMGRPAFWGCANYPRCKRTLKQKSDE